MNASSRMDSPTTPTAAPGTWNEALGNLIHARLCLLQLELGGAARQIGKSVLLLSCAALAMIFAWALGLAGGIAALAAATAWPWHWLALAAALVHLLAAALCLRLAKASDSPALPITRAEFQKDCEWLNTLKTPRKSTD